MTRKELTIVLALAGIAASWYFGRRQSAAVGSVLDRLDVLDALDRMPLGAAGDPDPARLPASVGTLPNVAPINTNLIDRARALAADGSVGMRMPKSESMPVPIDSTPSYIPPPGTIHVEGDDPSLWWMTN